VIFFNINSFTAPAIFVDVFLFFTLNESISFQLSSVARVSSAGPPWLVDQAKKSS